MKLFGQTLPQSPWGQLQPSQQLIIVTVVVGLTVLFVAHKAILEPLGRQEHILREALGLAQQRADLSHPLDATHQLLQQAESQLLSRKRTGTVLRDISTLATTNGVTVDIITPQSPETLGQYAQPPIRIDATGTFQAILQFVRALETHSVPIRLEQVAIGLTTSQSPLSNEGPTSNALRARLLVSALLAES